MKGLCLVCCGEGRIKMGRILDQLEVGGESWMEFHRNVISDTLGLGLGVSEL